MSDKINPKYVYIKPTSKKNLLQSILSDIFTFGCLTFCIWFSTGSKFWTFICFLMIVMFIWAKAITKRSDVKRFETEQDLITYLQSQLPKESL